LVTKHGKALSLGHIKRLIANFDAHLTRDTNVDNLSNAVGSAST